MCTPRPHHIRCSAFIKSWCGQLYTYTLLVLANILPCSHTVWWEPQTCSCLWEPWLPYIFLALSQCVYVHQKLRTCMLTTKLLFTWHFESGLFHSHAQVNPDSIGIRSRLNPDYRILVRRWIISGFRSEIAQSRSQAPECARNVGSKRDVYGASFPNSLKSCAGAAIIATYIPV